MNSNPKTCILYDFLYCMGGAEKTTFIMQEAFLDSKICVDFVNRDSFKRYKKVNLIELGLPCASQALNAIKGIRNFKNKTRFLKDYDLVIYSGSYAPCAVHNQVRGKKVLYCHTIPRFAYDLYDHYLSSLPMFLRPFFKGLVAYTQRNYEKAFSQMDIVIANSENVRSRIQKYFNSDAVVINPPIDTSIFKWGGQGDYYLSTARLEKYKRVDLIVSAFKEMPDKKLVVASGGSELANLQRLAAGAPNITFTGWIDQDELVRFMGNAIATIYMPIDEDFGMSPVESMSAGKPVIAAKEGGILETVIDEKTGILVEPKVEKIVWACRMLSRKKALQMKDVCEDHSQNFSIDSFTLKLREEITKVSDESFGSGYKPGSRE